MFVNTFSLQKGFFSTILTPNQIYSGVPLYVSYLLIYSIWFLKRKGVCIYTAAHHSLTGRFVHNGRMATDNGWRLDDITTYWYWTVVEYVPKYWSIWILILLGIYLYLIRPSSFDSDLSSSSPSSSLNSKREIFLSWSGFFLCYIRFCRLFKCIPIGNIMLMTKSLIYGEFLEMVLF